MRCLFNTLYPHKICSNWRPKKFHEIKSTKKSARIILHCKYCKAIHVFWVKYFFSIFYDHYMQNFVLFVHPTRNIAFNINNIPPPPLCEFNTPPHPPYILKKISSIIKCDILKTYKFKYYKYWGYISFANGIHANCCVRKLSFFLDSI